MPAELPLREVLVLGRISALVALRQEQALAQELTVAIADNIPVTILREVLLQSLLFAGYAATINAFHVLNELVPDNAEFVTEPDTSFELWKERGAQLCKKIYGEHYQKLVKNVERLHPELSQWMIVEGYGKVLSRPFLSPRVRELLIIATTAALGVERQFHSHVRGALNVGATPEEIKQISQGVFGLISSDQQMPLRAILDRVLISS